MPAFSVVVAGRGYTSLQQVGSHCGDFSCFAAQALGHMGFISCGTWVQQLQLLGSRAEAQYCDMGFVAPKHVGSSWIRDWTYVPCTGRQVLYEWATREAPRRAFECVSITNSFSGFFLGQSDYLISESQGQHLVQKTQRKVPIMDLCQQGLEMGDNFTKSESWSK